MGIFIDVVLDLGMGVVLDSFNSDELRELGLHCQKVIYGDLYIFVQVPPQSRKYSFRDLNLWSLAVWHP